MNTENFRQDTNGLQGKIFLNSAGSSLMPKSVPEHMITYIGQEEEQGGYKTEIDRAADIAVFYTETARLLNCSEHQVAYAYNATDAYAKALSAIPFRQGDYILTSNDDYVSSQIAFLSLRKRFAIKILRANNLANGDLDLNNFESLVKQYRPVLVSLTHIPTNSGLVQNAEEIGKICRANNVWYLLDACQSIGQMPVDVQKIGCDFLSATGRKFLRGPRGTGFLYVSDKALNEGLEPLGIDMRGAEWTGVDEYTPMLSARRFELFDISYASLVGLTEAIRYANEIGLKNIYKYNNELCCQLRENLSGIPGLKVLDNGSQLSSIVTFHMEGHSLEKIEDSLKREHIIYSVSLKKNAMIDMEKKGLDWVIRFSPHYFNTLAEINTASDVAASIARQTA